MHQISIDRPAILELPKKNILRSVFKKTTQSFARLSHKNISTIFDVEQEGNLVFRSYEYKKVTLSVIYAKKEYNKI